MLHLGGVALNPKCLGIRGEDAAAAYLEHAGYTIVARNWSCRSGEIDVIALDGGTIVFAEVKTRSSERMGTPEEAVDERKQSRLARLARRYLWINGIEDVPVRFDVIAVCPIQDDRALLRHCKDAFEVT